MVKPKAKIVSVWHLLVLTLVLGLPTCDDATTGPDLAEQPSSGPVLDEPHMNIFMALRAMQEVRSSQVSAGDILELPQTDKPENRTARLGDTTNTRRVPEQSLLRIAIHPEHVETFEDLIVFIGGRPSLWLEIGSNVWLIVVFENEPARTPASVYVTVTAWDPG